MSLSQAAPSPFAVLLRRSKFASYDPAVGQVYTAHSSHAFRGDWGFKRPLPRRRRPGFITVSNVDSAEQHTKWNSAESSARWMRRWEELGKKLEVHENGLWRTRMSSSAWHVDSEFDIIGRNAKNKMVYEPLDEEAVPSNTTHDTGTTPRDLPIRKNPLYFMQDNVPNPEAMTPKRFQKYLDYLRTLRPEFKEFLKIYSQERQGEISDRQLSSEANPISHMGSGDIHMLLSAQKARATLVTHFLAFKAERELHSPASKRIGQRPHALAGLEYAMMSESQAKYLHKPAPGRHIGSNRASRHEAGDSRPKYDLVAVAGLVGSMAMGTHNIAPTDFGTRESPRMDKERGRGLFRMNKVVLHHAPQVVGHTPQGATDTRFEAVNFQVAHTSNLSNPHLPGSPEYVSQASSVAPGKGHWDRHPIPSSVVTYARDVHSIFADKFGEENSQKLMSLLTDMIEQN